jgi:hypothetical protein
MSDKRLLMPENPFKGGLATVGCLVGVALMILGCAAGFGKRDQVVNNGSLTFYSDGTTKLTAVYQGGPGGEGALEVAGAVQITQTGNFVGDSTLGLTPMPDMNILMKAQDSRSGGAQADEKAKSILQLSFDENGGLLDAAGGLGASKDTPSDVFQTPTPPPTP